MSQQGHGCNDGQQREEINAELLLHPRGGVPDEAASKITAATWTSSKWFAAVPGEPKIMTVIAIVAMKNSAGRFSRSFEENSQECKQPTTPGQRTRPAQDRYRRPWIASAKSRWR